MTTPAAETEPVDVLVRFEIAALGHNWRDEVRLTRTPLVDNLIAGGRLTVLGEDGAEPEAAEVEEQAAPVSWFGPKPAEG